MTMPIRDLCSKLKVSAANPGIKAFVTAPKSLKVVGIVRIGMEFGLLAIGEAGNYVRVNGSQVVNLDTQTVREALRAAGLTGSEPLLEVGPNDPALAVPTVTVRKRRLVAPRLQLQ
jgi:hypothetical protein